MKILQSEIERFHKYVQNKLIRFIFVGGINTVFGLSVYCLMIWNGLSYIWATLVSQILGVLFNFMTIGTLVFENSDKKLIGKFILSYVLTYLINIGINRVLQLSFVANEYFSGIVAIIVSALISFLILKYFVYNDNSHSKNEKA